MKKIGIEGQTYELRERKEISKGACDRVETLDSMLLSEYFDVIDLLKLDAKMKKQNVKGKRTPKTKEEMITMAATEGALREGKTLQDMLNLTMRIESVHDIMTVMLTTNMDYYELISDTFSQLTFLELLKASKELIGSYEDFTSGLGLNMKFSQAKKGKKPNIMNKTKASL